MTWFGPDTRLEVAGIQIAGPCVYASCSRHATDCTAFDPSEILLHARVRRHRDAMGEMGYWPWYARIEPGHRYEYLTWLASGKSSLPPAEGYLFLYFYGIERRLLVDGEDRGWALQEIVRLRKLDQPRVGTRDGRSFRQYSGGLLWFEIARTPQRFDRRSFETVCRLTGQSWTEDQLTAALAWVAARQEPLPASLARQIAANDPTSQRSVVLKRVTDEFNELFDKRYLETFGGEGLRLRVSKRPAWHTYRPASGGLSEVRCEVDNPLGIRSQFKPLPGIWNSCIADLRRLSRVSVSVDEGVESIAAWEAMPDELRADTDHPLTESVSSILADGAPASDDEQESRGESSSIVAAGRFAELIGIERRPKLTATQSRKLATTIEHTGYGIVPDARIAAVRYGWDELVAVVPDLDDEDVEPTRYNAAACVLRLGLTISQADGNVDDVELSVLMDHIDAVFDLSPREQQRLFALRDLLLRTGSSARATARTLEQLLPPDARRQVGRLLVVIAASTNGIDRSERSALRKAFRALDLTPELLEQTIADVLPEASEAEVSVRPAAAGRGAAEPIPSVEGTGSFRLNHDAITSIMSETRAVSALLAEAMGTLEQDPVEDGGAIVAVSESVEAEVSVRAAVPAGPGGPYESLFQALTARARWSRAEADGVARTHGIMLAAGLEAINDWAYDSLGAPLIEDEGDEIVLDRTLLEDQQ